jgi:hypothetical protein
LNVVATTAFVSWPAVTGQYTSTSAQVQSAAMPSGFDRAAIPIKGPASPTVTEWEAGNGTASPRFHVTATKRAPNVLNIRIDDMGLGVSGGGTTLRGMDA